MKRYVASFLTRPVSFRFLTRPVKSKKAAVLSWLATFVIYARLSFPIDFVNRLLFLASPLTVLANIWPPEGDRIGIVIGVTLASLVVLLLTCRRGLPRWKVMGASMLVWGFGPAFAANPRGFYAFLFGGVISYPFDVVLALVLVIGFDKLFRKVSRR